LRSLGLSMSGPVAFEKWFPCNVKKYRPKSLISIVGKIMERCVYKYIHNCLLANCIITPNI
jgi:hypothetical protein